MAQTRSQLARAKARERMAEEIKRQKLREEGLTNLFLVLDELEEVHTRIGGIMKELLDNGETRQSLQELSGLSSKEVNGLLERGEDKKKDTHDSEASDQ